MAMSKDIGWGDAQVIAGLTEVRLPVKASAVIYMGALVSFDSSDATVRPIAAGDKFAGVNFYSKADNASGVDGDVEVILIKKLIRKEVIETGVTEAQANGVLPVFAIDDNTLTLTNTSGSVHVGYTAKYGGATNTCFVEYNVDSCRIADITIAT